MFCIISKILSKIRIKLNIILLKLKYKNKLKISDVYFRKNFNVIIENGKIEIERGCFFNNNCSLNSLGEIKIGQNCLFGENVKMYDHNHNYKNTKVNIKEQGFQVGRISIGDNCWIGSNVTILKDVKIGNNVVVGANCLIYKSIPSNSVVKNKVEVIINPIKYQL